MYSKQLVFIVPIYFWKKKEIKKMKFEFDQFEKDLIIDTIQHRLYTDKLLVLNETIKEDLVELLRKVEENEYL